MDPETPPNIHANRYNDTRKPGQAQTLPTTLHFKPFKCWETIKYHYF